MKKLFYSLAAIVALFATSCVQTDVEDTKLGGEGVVTLSIQTSGLGSRAINDGTKANLLTYAVYDTNWKKLDQGTVADFNISANIELGLVKNQTYNFVFWAQNEDAGCYTLNLPDNSEPNVQVNYSGVVANNDNLDAFYGKLLGVHVTGPVNETVELRRPFAQINFGTTDLARAAKLGFNLGAANTTVSVKTETYNQFYLGSGNVAGSVQDVTFTAANPIDKSADEATLKVKDIAEPFHWVSMNYILVPADTTTSLETCEMTISAEGKSPIVISVPQAPAKRNWRTNLVGSLLIEQSNIEVIIKPEFEGEQTNTTGYYLVNDVYHITSGQGLAWVADQVNSGSLSNPTIVLENDIDLSSVTRTGSEWIPIGTDQKHFKGTIEGNGHTITGLKVTERHNTDRAALIGTVSGTVVLRNFTIKDAEVRCPDYTSDFYGAALIGTMYGNVTIENVNVMDSYVSGNNKVGALVAHDGVCSSLKINNCHVSGVTFEALNTEDGGSVGGLVGYFQGVKKQETPANYGDHYIENSSVQNCTFNVINSTNSHKRANGQLIGGINSGVGQVLNINKCVINNNVWNEKFYENNVEVTDNKFVSPYGGLIGGERDGNQEGKIIVDGYELVSYGVGLNDEGEYVITADAGISSIKALIAADASGFAGKTIVLDADVDLANVKDMGNSNAPIGSTGERDGSGKLICKPFKGTFDGNGKTIKNLYQSGWDMGYEWGKYGSCGLFAELESATVKNVVIESLEAQVEGGDISFIAGSATGDCVFENITITNSKIGTYNNGCGGIIGWSGAGTYTFKNITIGEDVVLGGLWGSFDSSIGGIVGQAEPGATYNFENVTINCRIDAYNDCTASYDYYNYRMCGMIIGRCEATTTINGRNYPDLSKYNLSFNNVTVNYGTWMNYHYCEPTPELNGGRGMRIEPGYAYGGLPADFDHSQCTTNHYACIPFDQLIGGDQLGVKGLPAVDGVTVNYPAEYTCPLCGQQHNVK